MNNRSRHVHVHRPRGLRNLSIALIVLLILPVALWLVFSKIETTTETDTTTKTSGNASALAQKSPQHDTQSVAPAQKTTQHDTQFARKDTEPSLQSTKNDLETRMGRVYERDNRYFFQDVNEAVNRTARNLSPAKQVPVDDKLTAEGVFASRDKDEVQIPDRTFNFEGERCKGCSESERLRYFGLIRIHLMAALTLYNDRCFVAGMEDARRPTGDKAEALAIIENQVKKLPREVQEKALDNQVKAIEAYPRGYNIWGDLDPGGWKWFCDRMNNDIERGYADPMFRTAREGFFPIEGN